jgi:hypothetical protein
MEPNILDDIDGDLAEIEAIERTQKRMRAFSKMRDRIKEQKLSGAAIARQLGRSSSQINACLRGEYPWYGGYGLPKYLYDFLIDRGLATEKEITWMRRA